MRTQDLERARQEAAAQEAAANAMVARTDSSARRTSPHPEWALAGRPAAGPRWILWKLWLALRLYKLSPEARTPKKQSVKYVSPHPKWALAGEPAAGPRWILWRLWLALRMYKVSWIPQPRPWGLYAKRAEEMREQLLDIRSRTHAIIVTITTKGGACKTTVTTWLGAAYAALVKKVVIIFDTDSGGGNVLTRFGLEDAETLTSTEVVRRRGRIMYKTLTQRAQTDRATGAFLIHSPAGEEFEGSALGDSIVMLHKVNAHTTVVDTGPGFNKPNTNSAVQVADVIVLTGDFQQREHIGKITKTLDHPSYSLRNSENIGRVIIAVSAVKWRHFNTRTQHALAEKFGVKSDQVVLIPYSLHFKNAGLVDLGLLSPKMLFAWTQLALRCAEVVERLGRRNQQVPVSSITTPTQQRIGARQQGPSGLGRK